MIAVATILALALAQAPEELVRQLGHEEASRREEAASALEALGEAALPALEQGAKSVDPEVRERAAEVLSTVRMTLMVGRKLNPDRLAHVRAAIDDWRARVRDHFGGGEEGEPTAYDDLIEFSGDERQAADLADIPYLLGILWDPGPAEGEVGGLPRGQYLRWRALQAVRHFPITDENEERLIAILRAVLPKGDRPATEAEDRYWGAVFSEAAQVTQLAIRKAIRERTLSALRVLAKSSQVETRLRVAYALTSWDDDEVAPVLAALLEDTDPTVQKAAVASLEDRNPSAYREVLPRVLEASHDPWTRCIAAQALARCGETAGIDALFQIAADPDTRLWNKAFSTIQDLIAPPESLAQRRDRVLEDWQAWWTENRATRRWDPELEKFVRE